MLSNLNENYYLRKCFEEKNEVPTQSTMKKHMGDALAKVYFESMTHKLKVYAGLEPTLKGGGKDQLVHPSDLLAGRSTMKPMKKEHLQKLGYTGICLFVPKLLEDHQNSVQLQSSKMMKDADSKWKNEVATARLKQWGESTEIESNKSKKKLKEAMKQFEMLYVTSLTELESVLQYSSVKSVLNLKDELHAFMESQYLLLLQQQNEMIIKRFSKKLIEKQFNMKKQFIACFENERKTTVDTVKEIYNEKQKATDTMRERMGYQNLAFEAYIALTEKFDCRKQSEEIQEKHTNVMKDLTDSIALGELTFQDLKENEIKTQYLNQLWQNKVDHIMSYFKTFVLHCLKCVPEQADFFKNIEQMMNTHLKDTLDDHDNSNYFLLEDECPVDIENETCTFDSETAKLPVKPFVICGDFKRKYFDKNLCKTARSKSNLPLFVVNKKFIYSACDNYEMFSDKLEEFIDREGATILADSDESANVIETQDDFTLETSLLNFIRSEILHILNEVPCTCACTCECDISEDSSDHISDSQKFSISDVPVKKLKSCECALKVKKKLKDHMPLYMMGHKRYPSNMLPQYVACTPSILKILTTKKISENSSTPSNVTPLCRDIGTQFGDIEYETICFCIPDEIEKLLSGVITNSQIFNPLETKPRFKVMGSSLHDYDCDSRMFAMNRAESLKIFLIEHPSVANIFSK